jgi:hypothetical protein
MTTVTRKNEDGSRITVPCPQSVQQYNSYMRGSRCGRSAKEELQLYKEVKKVVASTFLFLGGYQWGKQLRPLSRNTAHNEPHHERVYS